MKRKTLCFVMSIFLIMQAVSFNIVVDADEIDATQEEMDITKEITVLSRLGIVNIDLENGYDGNAVVTRAKFIEYLARAINIIPVTDKIYFKDVPKDHWAVGSVNGALEMGIIDPSPDKLFYPNEPITYEQACKIMVNAAGYKSFALLENMGMYGYTVLARRLGIDIQVKNPSSLTFSEAVKIIYNGLSVNILVNKGTKSEVDKEKTLFSVYHNIYVEEGNVTSVYGAYMEGSKKARKDEVIIDGQEFSLYKGYSINDYFGCYVEYIYRKNLDDTYTLYYAEPIKSRNQELILVSDLIEDFDVENYKISYYMSKESSKLAHETIDRGAVIIYNGTPYEGKASDVFDEFISGTKKGLIRLFDKNNDGQFDTLIVKSYEVFVAGAYDDTRFVLYNYYDTTRQIKLDDYKVMRLINEYGSEVHMPTVFPFVSGVAESGNNEFVELVVWQNQLSGTITGVNDGEFEVSIDDGEFIRVNKSLWNSERTLFQVGNKVTVTFDQFGYIAYVQLSESEDIILAYLIKAFSDRGVDAKFGLRLYTQNKTLDTYYLAETVTIDGKRYKREDYRNLFRAFPGGASFSEGSSGSVKVLLQRQLIRIKLNSDGAINYIDTFYVGANEDAENTLTRKHDGTVKLLYNNSAKRFGLDTLYNPAYTKIFVVPMVNAAGEIVINGVAREETPDMYATAFEFTHDDYYYIETYEYNYSNFYTDVIVVRKEPTYENETIFMFESISKALSEDGEVLNKMNGYTGGSKVSYLVDDTIADKLNALEVGDIIRVDTDPFRNVVVNIVKMYDAGTRTFENGNSNPYWYGGKFDINGQWAFREVRYQLSKSYVFDINNGIIKSTYEFADLYRGVVNEVLDASKVSITVFDNSQQDGHKVFEGTLKDIITYKSAGNACSFIVTNYRSGIARQIFVYK